MRMRKGRGTDSRFCDEVRKIEVASIPWLPTPPPSLVREGELLVRFGAPTNDFFRFLMPSEETPDDMEENEDWKRLNS